MTRSIKKSIITGTFFVTRIVKKKKSEYCHFYSELGCFSLLNTKEDILKNYLMELVNFIVWTKTVLQNVSFCVQQKKNSNME